MRAKKPPRVLVAEDDREMRAIVAQALRRAGYAVTEARDGATAVDHIGSCLLHRIPDPPDVVIADIRMPALTGLSLLASVRDLGLPVILITAFGDDHTHELARRLGAVTVFDKPFDIDRLCAAVELVAPLPS